MSAIPVSLREGIAEFCESVAGPEIARRAAHQSVQYRSGGGSRLAERADIAAYLTTRLPATYAAISAALAQVQQRAPQFSPSSMLDFGAGPGTASWAAVEACPGVRSVAMKDRSAVFLSAAKELAQHTDHPALQHASMEISGSFRDDEHYDLIVASYVTSESAVPVASEIATQLWSHCRGLLVIVEPGTPAGFQRILRARETLIARDAVIAAPCPGSESCPISAPDWCHFSVRLPRSRDHMRAKSANVPYEDEKFSWIASARNAVTLLPPSPRIIAPVKSGKAGLRFRLCTGHGISEVESPRRDRTTYRSHARRKWGDTL